VSAADHTERALRSCAPAPAPRWLTLAIFVLAVTLLGLLRDVRIPVDGAGFAVTCTRLGAGDLEDAFCWSHVLHVPAVLTGHRLITAVFPLDLLSFYQRLDILLGAVSLCLLCELLRRLHVSTGAAVTACLLLGFSWTFWSEAVTADEKMTGFCLVLLYLNLLLRTLAAAARDGRRPATGRAVMLGLILATAVLMHASALLVVPASAVLFARYRAVRSGLLAGAVAGGVVLLAYAAIVRALDLNGSDEILAFFSPGWSRYSVAVTRVSGWDWAQQVAQGFTKLHWAVFAEDGPRAGLLLAGCNAILMVIVLRAMWHDRHDRQRQWLAVLFVTAGLFGATYAPEVPDSYFLASIPVAASVAVALRERRLRWLALGLLAILIVNNGLHFVRFSAFQDNRADMRYQRALAGLLTDGDHLVALDEAHAATVGTQAIMPVHAYFQPAVALIPCSEFFAAPLAGPYRQQADRGRLFIEGLCFENHDNRALADVRQSASFRRLAAIYDLQLVIPFAEYSSLYHRAYKGVFRVRPGRS